MKKLYKPLIVLLLAVSIQACGGDSADKSSSSTPNGSVMNVIESMKNNDIHALMKASMSTADYQKTVKEFDENKGTPTEADKAQFSQMMGMLTTDGAVDTIMAMATPQLEQMRTQMPMMLAMGKGMVAPTIQSNTSIPDDQKESLTKIANAFIDFASDADLLSDEITRKAIAVAVDTAKSLNMKSLDEVKDMSFEQAMDKASLVFGGFKDILDVYGISVNKLLDSVDLTDVVENGDTASMKLTYKFLGEAFNQTVKLNKKDGKWLSNY